MSSSLVVSCMDDRPLTPRSVSPPRGLCARLGEGRGDGRGDVKGDDVREQMGDEICDEVEVDTLSSVRTTITKETNEAF